MVRRGREGASKLLLLPSLKQYVACDDVATTMDVEQQQQQQQQAVPPAVVELSGLQPLPYVAYASKWQPPPKRSMRPRRRTLPCAW